MSAHVCSHGRLIVTNDENEGQEKSLATSTAAE
jgi:hypothetical protein